MKKFKTDLGEYIHISTNEEPLGSGLEAKIYNIIGRQKEVAKIFQKKLDESEQEFNRELIEKEKKIKYMVKKCPKGSLSNPIKGKWKNEEVDCINIAWPIRLLYDEENKFSGYIMPKINTLCKFKQFLIKRKKYFPNMTKRKLYIIAYNLINGFKNIHDNKVVICDGNPDNFLVNSNGLISFIDTDSYQLKDELSGIFKSYVFTKEVNPPEYSEDIFNGVFTEEGDCFILAIMLFQLLMNGAHPFVGRILKKNIDNQDIEITAIKNGWFAYEANDYLKAPSNAPNYIEEIPQNLRRLFHRCFCDGIKQPNKRPTAKEWLTEIENVMENATDKTIESDESFNEKKKFPFILLMDITLSMKKFKNSLQKGYDVMLNNLRKLDHSEQIDFCLIEFAYPPRVKERFKSVSETSSYKIEFSGSFTSISGALDLALDELRKRKLYYQEKEINYKCPKIILMTDGISYGKEEDKNLKKTLSKIESMKNQIEIECIAIGELEPEPKKEQDKILKSIATRKKYIRLSENANDDDFKSLFEWVSVNVSSVNIDLRK